MITRLLSVALRCGVVGYSTASLRRIWLNRRRPAAVLSKEVKSSNGKIIIVTTAAIPWRTGTAVNPALRAAHLAADTHNEVILVVPFIPIQDQALIFPEGVTCRSPEQQAGMIKVWAREHSKLPHVDFQIIFYQARYYPASRCIFAAEDICKLLPREQVSLVVLEEPEHLNWYSHRQRWSSQFGHVVGVLHTHYSGYAADLPGGFINAAAVGLVCRVVCRLHCHKVVQLSELAKHLARSTVVNVHGVSAKFLEAGAAKSHCLRQQQQQQFDGPQRQQQLQAGPESSQALPSCFDKCCYFLGKALWDKGHGELMDLLEAHGKKHGQQVNVDVYGVGPDLPAIQADACKRSLPLVFKGQADHCSPELQEYKVFINCCKKDVLATATAEAVAMNKWVILPDVACNRFFRAFPNVLLFSSSAAFSQVLLRALEQEPPALSAENLRELSWTAATERLLAAASIHSQEWPGAASQALDDCLWVPYRMFALLFRGARNTFAPPPKLLQHCQQQQEEEVEGCGQLPLQEQLLGEQQQELQGQQQLLTC